MIDEAIVSYLSDNKRLIVPQFGAFVKRPETGDVVFMEFLKNDDGELSSYLQRNYSLDQASARREIERFVAQVKTQIIYSGLYLIEGLGALKSHKDNMYRLDYDPAATRLSCREQSPACLSTAEGAGVERQAVESVAASGGAEDNSVKELRYGKPSKRANPSGKRRTDIIMIIALLSTLLAVGVFIYGVLLDDGKAEDLFGSDGQAIEMVNEAVVDSQ